MSQYFIRARLYPTLITIIPILLLYYFTLGTELNKTLGNVLAIPIVLHLTISGSLIYALTLLNRFVAKELFQRIYFNDEKRMPTTTLLLNQDDVLSKDMKAKLYAKIASDFNIQLLNDEGEQKDDHEARKQIVFAVSQIRNKTRENKILLQHNIEYGFMRNLVGGSFIALLVCIANIIVFTTIFPVDIANRISIGAFIIYMLLVVFSKYAVSRHAKNYAKVLFEQYLST